MRSSGIMQPKEKGNDGTKQLVTDGTRRKRRMLRIVSAAVRDIALRANATGLTGSLISKQFPVTQAIKQRFFGAFSSTINRWDNVGCIKQKALIGRTETNNVAPVTLTLIPTSVRTITKFSRQKGKRKSAKAVVDRFYRLNWGIWIRTRAGRKKSIWRKSLRNKYKAKQHVFCNATQSTLLDKMVTRYWRRPHYYVDDPYNPYHAREEFPFTRRKPRPL
ncbi:mitochondrial ribosomal protein L35 [Xylocopa sonorina]|uniref:mitochondrial ribosomal protein L35 n=1 Tax=Xylocopa sonorina TaxID=1818115 RepID=UPI00403B2718